MSGLSRRRFLHLSAGLVAGATVTGFLAACGEPDSAPTTGTSQPTSTGSTNGASPATPTASAGGASDALPEMTSAPEALKGSGEVRIVSYGGTFQEAQRKAYFEPFERLTGIKVVESEGPESAKLKAMVDTGNVEWDVALLSRESAIRLQKLGDYLEEIDYSLVDVDNISEVFRYKYSLGALAYSHIIAYRTDAFQTAPTGWKDFWDVENFPGPRSMPAGTGASIPSLVGALLADGVPREEVYPIDLDRAFASLDRIRDHVAKFTETEAMPVQMLVDNEITMGVAANGRIKQIMAEGAPVDLIWQDGSLMENSWCVPKGAKNLENAMKFIAFTTLPISQARLSMLLPYGFVNAGAAEYLPEDVLQSLPTSPGIVEKLIPYDDEWWVEHRQEVEDRWTEWVLS